MNFKQLNSIGSGVPFPIKLAKVQVEEEVPTEDGNVQVIKKELTSWKLIQGDIDLIRQNIISILTFLIGQRIRQEYFGSRVHECIEEPNTNVQSFTVKKFIKEAISTWEPRIKALDVNLTREFDKLYIHIRFQINYDQSIGDVNVQLDL